MSIKCTFNENIEMQQIVKKAMYFDYVRVTDKHLYLELSYELLDHIVFFDISLRHYLDRTDHSALFLCSKNHSSECTFTELFYYYKILDS